MVGEWIFPADRRPSSWKKFIQHSPTDTQEIDVLNGVDLTGFVLGGIFVAISSTKTETEKR